MQHTVLHKSTCTSHACGHASATGRLMALRGSSARAGCRRDASTRATSHAIAPSILAATAAAVLLHASSASASEVTSLHCSPVGPLQSTYITAPVSNNIADISESPFLGFGGTADGSNPFTVYGIAFKKYVIEVLDGEKIVSRKRGFTVDSCTTAISVAAEDQQGPQFQGLPIGEKVRIAGQGSTICRRSEGPDLAPACQSSCESTCSATVDQYVKGASQETGIDVEDSQRQRVLKSCVRNCRIECSKPGKVFDFIVPSRR